MAKRATRKVTTPKRRPEQTVEERIAGLEERASIMQNTIGSINRLVASLADGLPALNESLRVARTGALDMGLLFASYICALRDLLLEKGLITYEEASRIAEIAGLEHMLDRPSDTDRDSAAPGGEEQ